MKLRRAGALAALTVLFAVLLPRTASGHAALIRADPAENAFLQRSPPAISLTFVETVDHQSSSIKLLNAQAQLVTTGVLVVSPDGLTLRVDLQVLKPGIYNVLWANVSTVDGHALRGSYPFTVLNTDGTLPAETNSVAGLGSEPDPAPLAEGIAVRALSLLGLALVGAGVLILLIFPATLSSARRGLRLCAFAGIAVLAVATLLNLQLLRETYPDRDLWSVVRETRSGSYWLVRLGALPILAVGTWLLLESRRTASAAVLAGGIAYLWAYSATSHAAAGAGSGWAIAFDMLHGLTAVAWIGGVVGVALTARLGGKSPDYRVLMPRFGLLASVMVFLLLATGFLSSLVELDSLDGLWTTRYGWTLTVKLGLMIPLLLVAMYNARRGAKQLAAEAPGEPRRFVRFAVAEALLGGLVVAAAAGLTQTTVAKSVFERPTDKPFDQVSTADAVTTRLQVDPNRTGLNTYTITLADAAGQPITADRVRLTFRYLDDQSVGPSTLTLVASEAGKSVGQGPYFTLEGGWRVEVEIRRANIDDLKAFFQVRPAGNAIGTVRTGGDWANPAPGVGWNKLAGFIAALVGGGIVAFKGRVRRPRTTYVWATNGATLAAFGLAGLLLFGVHSHDAIGTLPTNPIFPDQNSISHGRTIFQQNCAACHGISGVPPTGLDLSPYPLDLTIHVPVHPDGQLFQFISNGIPNSAMRSWSSGRGGLTDEQIWHVVNYLRTLTASDR